MATLPSRVGNFEVLSQIGSGGMGVVYLGRDPELDRQVAIKVIREEVHDQEVLDRFFREARAAAALRHPNIITIYASGQHDYQPYMAMEYVDGESLADVIRLRRNVALADKISYLEQICAGLHFAHHAGIVHRDVKPANIMVDREGVVRILDFGIARIEGSAMTQDGSLMGSLNYMSPEQMLGRPIDHRSDIFSVGVVAYELLCYQQAFKGGLNDGLLQRLPNEDPPAMAQIYPGLPPALERVVMRALEKAPEKRFQNLVEMRSAIVGGHASPQPEDDRTISDPAAGSAAPADHRRAGSTARRCLGRAAACDLHRRRQRLGAIRRGSRQARYFLSAPARAAAEEGGCSQYEIHREWHESRRPDRDATRDRRRDATTAEDAARAFSEDRYWLRSGCSGHRCGSRNSMAHRGAAERAGTGAAGNCGGNGTFPGCLSEPEPGRCDGGVSEAAA